MNSDSALQINTKPLDTESRTVDEIIAEDVSSFDRLYKENSQYIYNTCLGILGSSEDARDATQDTFVQFYRSLPKIRNGCAYRTWLYRVAVNKCMDIIRRHHRCAHVDSLDWFREECTSADDNILEEHVRQSILRLKPEYRAAIVLFYFQQLSYAEIAESLGCSQSQVRTRLHRARKAFRLVFDNRGDDIEM